MRVERLAAAAGAPLFDFAWIGATTGVGNYGDGGTVTSLGAYSLPGMTSVFNLTKAGLGPFAANGLFVVWGGPSRLRYHGINPLAEGLHPLTGRHRINLTFRKAR